jgi:hypothetical protein
MACEVLYVRRRQDGKDLEPFWGGLEKKGSKG